jgi:arginyl-tRNA---protein transferase
MEATAAPSASGSGASVNPSSRISLSLITDYGPGASTCGYCGSKQDVNWSHGMQAEFMTVETYQALLDRGWRRSGRWIYKPMHAQTCCQLITIRLDVEKFQLSKDQRQVQRKWEAHLAGAALKQKNQAQQQQRANGPEDEFEQQQQQELQGGSPKRMREEDQFDDDDDDVHGWESYVKELQGGGKRQRSSHNLAAMDEKEGEENEAEKEKGDDDDSKLNRAASPTTELSEQLQIAYVGTVKRSSFSKGESQPWSPKIGNGLASFRHHQPSSLPASATTIAVAAPSKEIDLSVNLREELQAALERCIEAGKLPDLDYPLPKVSQLSAKQRKSLPSDVGYTSPAPLAVTGVANRAENCGGGEDDENFEVPMYQPLSLQSTAQLLIDQMQLPEGIAGAEVTNGHINFKIRRPEEHISADVAATSTPCLEVEKAQQTQHIEVKEKLKKATKPRPLSASPAGAATTHLKTDIPRSPPRHFELIMVPSSDERLPAVEFELYKKYQTIHHGDSPSSVTKSSFSRFLCESPLIPAPASFYPPGGAPPSGFGSFHQQYWLDGRLIAVGVIDVLPKALSSKYLFWDPDYASLSLGKLASIQEIAWIKEAHASCPSLKYYYLGYYLHTCHRMRYKAEFGPSDLLCPVKQCWVPIDRVTAVLDENHRAPALADIPGALKGLDNEYLVNSEAKPLLPPHMPSPEEVKAVKLFVRSGGEGAQRRGQIVTFGVLKELGVLKDGLIAHLQHRLQEWVMMVGPAWKNIAYKLE